MKPRKHHQLWAALGFLLPNFLGFVLFTAGPVLFSLGVSFTNWNLQRTIPFRFIGLENFRELASDQDFWLYFLNTVYLMLAWISHQIGLKERPAVAGHGLRFVFRFTAGHPAGD